MHLLIGLLVLLDFSSISCATGLFTAWAGLGENSLVYLPVVLANLLLVHTRRRRQARVKTAASTSWGGVRGALTHTAFVCMGGGRQGRSRLICRPRDYEEGGEDDDDGVGGGSAKRTLEKLLVETPLLTRDA